MDVCTRFAVQPLGMKWLSRRGGAPLILIVLIAGLGWAAVGISNAVMQGHTLDLDTQILLGMRTPGDMSDPIGPGWFEEAARDFTAFGGVIVLIVMTMFVAGYLGLRRSHRIMWFVLGAVGGGIVASHLLKFVFSRPRPDLVPYGSVVYTSSFPSGHSMTAAATYLTLAALLARSDPRARFRVYFFAVAIALTVTVGVSRVYLGVHWPSDVLAGWTMGALWALMCWTVARTRLSA